MHFRPHLGVARAAPGGLASVVCSFERTIVQYADAMHEAHYVLPGTPRAGVSDPAHRIT